MPCRRGTYNKIMIAVRSHYPHYSLKRRKKIVISIIYRRKKKVYGGELIMRMPGHTRRIKRRSSSARKRKGVSYKYVRVKGVKRKR